MQRKQQSVHDCSRFIAAAWILGLTSLVVGQNLDNPNCTKNSLAPKNNPSWNWGAKGVIVFSLFKPANYVKTQKYPLAITLHGAGERGNCNTTWFDWAETDLWISAAEQAKHPCFVMTPQCDSKNQWVNTPWGTSPSASYSITTVGMSTSLQAVMDLIKDVQDSFPIDPARIYISGGSMGGFGAWDAALRYPAKFAAVVPIAGAGDPSKASLLVNVPIWAVHGDQDGIVLPTGTREMINAIKQAGGNPKYTEIKGEGHIWMGAESYAPGITDWMFAQKLGSSNVRDCSSHSPRPARVDMTSISRIYDCQGKLVRLPIGAGNVSTHSRLPAGTGVYLAAMTDGRGLSAVVRRD